MARPQRLRPIVASTAWLFRAIKVSRHGRIAKKFLDALRLVKRWINSEDKIRDKLQPNLPGDPPPQKRTCATKRAQHRVSIAATKRHHKNRANAEVGADAHLGDCHGHADEPWITDLALLKDRGKDMAKFLADAKLTLGWAAFTLPHRH
jgi:hypothetical protein